MKRKATSFIAPGDQTTAEADGGLGDSIDSASKKTRVHENGSSKATAFATPSSRPSCPRTL
jgi:hypothetical protein